MAALLLVLGALAPLEARFLLEAEGTPLAVLRVAVRGHQYEYEATHFLEEGDTAWSRSWVLDERGAVDGLVPEVLFLLHPPRAGCHSVLEERRGVPETLCVDASGDQAVTGTLDGTSFEARYERGHLAVVRLPGLLWRRVEGSAPVARGASPFARGFVVRPVSGPLRLLPPLPGARVVHQVRGTGGGAPERRRCLTVARAAVARDPRLELVLGLVVEGGRAFPHAWVRQGPDDEDPSLLADDDALRAERWYLALPRGSAGRAYLELLDGRRAIVGDLAARGPAHAPRDAPARAR